MPSLKRSSFNLELRLLGALCLTVTHPHLLLGPTTPTFRSQLLALQSTSRGPACSHLDFGVWTLVVLFTVRREKDIHTGWPWMWGWGLWMGNSRLQGSWRLRIEASPQALGGQTLWTPSWSLGRESLHSLCKNTATGGTEPGPRTQERRI